MEKQNTDSENYFRLCSTERWKKVKNKIKAKVVHQV